MDPARTKKQNLFARLNRRLRLSMSVKIGLYFGLIFLIVAAMTVAVTLSVIDASVRTAGRDRARTLAQNALEATRDGADPATVVRLLETDGATLCIEADDGTVLAGARDDGRDYETDFPTVGKVVFGRLSEDGIIVFVRLDLSAVFRGTIAAKIVLAACLLVSFLAVGLVGSVAAHSVTKPIRTMTETTRTITKESLGTRLDADETQDELRELAVVINAMLDDLQETIREQARFVGDASHELRTPIAVIKGHTSMLLRWGKSDPAILDESLAAIAKETDNMRLLIDNLLFLSRTDREVVGVTFEKFVLGDLADELIREYTILDTTHIFLPQKMEVVEVEGNPDMIRQLLRSIIDNARKYSPSGSTVELSCTNDPEGTACFTVTDHGIGISAEDLPRVFDRFYRADSARTHDGGYGLGMSIAKKIADVHGGEIRIESQIGEGTCVKIFLPHRQERSDDRSAAREEI